MTGHEHEFTIRVGQAAVSPSDFVPVWKCAYCTQIRVGSPS